MASSHKLEPRDTNLSLRVPATSDKPRPQPRARRHGLTTETVIEALEDEAEYKAFELSVTAGFEAETAVQRELVLRLASLLWRLRRASAMETGLLQISGEVGDRQTRGQLTVLEPFCKIPHRPQSRRDAAKRAGMAADPAQHTAADQSSRNRELAERYLKLDLFDGGGAGTTWPL